MKQVLVLFFFLVLKLSASAQNGANGVYVHEDPRISQYLDKYSSMQQAPVTNYIYRIQLVSTYNRDEAYQVQGRYRNLFPNESSFLNHDGVKFIVRAGAFNSRVDAEVALGEIRKNFPSSFILPPEVRRN